MGSHCEALVSGINQAWAGPTQLWPGRILYKFWSEPPLFFHYFSRTIPKWRLQMLFGLLVNCELCVIDSSWIPVNVED